MENQTVTSNRQSLTEAEKNRFRLWLQRQFTERCKRNARYSLRAFAKSLDIDASSLSQILGAKRPLSKKAMLSICEKLSATPKDLGSFGLVQSNQNFDDDSMQVSVDTFSVMADWYHYALLELTYVSGFKADPKWIAKKLSISVEEAKTATERLKRLGLLFEENGSLIKSSKFLTNQSSVNTSGAHRELQKQVITKALLAVEECPAEQKDITSMTMAIDVSNLDKARDVIRKFRRELCALLEEGDQSQVYNLGIQLYPISKKEESV
jgi:Ni,Fe-hydrogenase I small subunit